MELRERGKGKEKEKILVISHTINVKVEDIRMCIENS
jgi:hypothetical protein